MAVFRCEWCGRFFSSELPEPTGCADHIVEANEKLRRDIARFNAKLSDGLAPEEG